MIKMRRVLSIFRKEIYHIVRDPFTLIMALVMPVIMVLMFGSAVEFNVQNVATTYIDESKTPSSLTFLNLLGSSKYFQLTSTDNIFSGYKRMEREQAKALIIIPPTFEYDVLGNNTGHIQILLDGTDNTAIGAIGGYIGFVQAKACSEICKITEHSTVKLVPKFLFNPELNSQWFIVPGLAAVVMAILSILLTALTISREWERGSMELLLSTPVRPLEIVVGKIMPYAILGLVSVIVVYIVARTFYSVPFVGSHLVFFCGTILFLFAYLGLGLLVSTVVRNQQAAVQIAMAVGLMPSMLFSGFIFALEHMPFVFKCIATIFPARWYVTIARDQFLKGSSLQDLWLPFTALSISAYFIVQLCVAKFKRTLEQ
ncbi:MAG: ABC transporter permease [Holosporales bacterium]|jgi:ABC-2 type transport system permease protein|nr:ABC transporter permease [Holosporales bacterium]